MTEVGELRQVTVIDCEEYGTVEIDPRLLIASDGLTLDLNDDIRSTDFYRVSFSQGRLRLTASSYVGVIPLNRNVVIKVRPRVPVTNLTQMVRDTGYPTLALRAFREYRGHGTADDWVMDLYSGALLDYVDEILNRGLYREYSRHDGEGAYPRGRMNFHDTATRFAARGIANRAAFSWYERSVDTPPNRCIRAALKRVHRHLTRGPIIKGYGTMIARLAGQINALAEVRDDPDRQFLTDPEVAGVRQLPEARYYYRPALDLAGLILRGQGFALDLGGADVRLGSLLIEMNTLFESYVRSVLQREAQLGNWPVRVLDQQGAVPLYQHPNSALAPLGEELVALGPKTGAKATPDIILRMPDGEIFLAIEVKNTAKGGVLPDRSEVNQAVTYAVRYGLDKALLVRPFISGRPGLAYGGRIGKIDLFDYKFDLRNHDLSATGTDFAAAVAGLMPAGATELINVIRT